MRVAGNGYVTSGSNTPCPPAGLVSIAGDASEYTAPSCALLGLAIAVVPDGTGPPAGPWADYLLYTTTPSDFVMPQDGRVWLLFNDVPGGYGDNSGSYSVTVTVGDSLIPTTYQTPLVDSVETDYVVAAGDVLMVTE